MSDDVKERYEPGISAVNPERFTAAIERKSPPLVALQPNKDDYLQIEPARYTSRDWMERERERLWPNVWLCAGRVSDLPEIGNWLRFDLGAESIIVTRSGPDRFSALYNVCQHRGNRLVDDEFGKSAAFICPYHSWTYDLTGKCRGVTDRQYFKSEALRGNIDSGGIRCEAWAGNLWIAMGEEAPPLAEYLNDVMPIIDSFAIETMHIVLDVVVDLQCNWKGILDAFSESYHVHRTHPEGMPITEDIRTQLDFYQYGHSRQWVPVGFPSSRFPCPDEPNELQKFMLADVGIDPEGFAGSAADVPDAIRAAKRSPDYVYGVDCSALTDSQLTDEWAMNIFPNMQMIPHPEGVLMDRYYPHPHDPMQSRLHVMVLAPVLAAGRVPPGYMGVAPDADMTGQRRPARRYVSSSHPDLRDIIGEVLWQDVRNIEACQAGMRSRRFEVVRFSEQEQRNQHQFAEMDRYLMDEPRSRGRRALPE